MQRLGDAALQFAGGLAKDPAEIDANYVRRSDAELLWRDPDELGKGNT